MLEKVMMGKGNRSAIVTSIQIAHDILLERFCHWFGNLGWEFLSIKLRDWVILILEDQLVDVVVSDWSSILDKELHSLLILESTKDLRLWMNVVRQIVQLLRCSDNNVEIRAELVDLGEELSELSSVFLTVNKLLSIIETQKEFRLRIATGTLVLQLQIFVLLLEEIFQDFDELFEVCSLDFLPLGAMTQLELVDQDHLDLADKDAERSVILEIDHDDTASEVFALHHVVDRMSGD